MNAVYSQCGRHVVVSGFQDPFSSLYFNGGTEHPVGAMRVNPSTRNLQVYTGANWQDVQKQYVNVDLTPVANEALDWAIRQVKLEREAQKLAEKNNSVKLALDALEQARQNLSVITTLAQSEEENRHV